MIQVKDNILSITTLKNIENYLNDANWRYGWPSNKNIPFGHWNLDITKTVANNPTDVSNRLPEDFDDLWKEINTEFFNSTGVLTRCYANRHTFGTEGYIHTDTERKEDVTVVVYLNPEWEADWGGETTFYSFDKKSILNAVLPAYGRVVAFSGNIPHCARAITRICSKARTTVMYKVTIDPKAVYSSETMLVEFLKEIGADKMPHKNGSLMDHLIRCYFILKNIGANDILAISAGLHSVYSTNAYKNACLPYESKKIEETFGPEVDRLVRMFSKIDRPNALENPDGTLSDIDLFLLRSIECANLHDQNELDPKKYPNLMDFIKQFIKG